MGVLAAILLGGIEDTLTNNLLQSTPIDIFPSYERI
jgi:hypothetical protein